MLQLQMDPSIKKEVSNALREAVRSNSNLNMVIITGLLNNSLSKLQPSTGPNGLPILTVNDVKIVIPEAVARVLGCALLGLSLGGGMGAADRGRPLLVTGDLTHSKI